MTSRGLAIAFAIPVAILALLVASSCGGGGNTGGPAVGDVTCDLFDPPYCAQDFSTEGDEGVFCSTVSVAAACDKGQTRCPDGTIDVRRCTCTGAAPSPACKCRSNGWQCPPDASADGA